MAGDYGLSMNLPKPIGQPLPIIPVVSRAAEVRAIKAIKIIKRKIYAR
jgi:hypothetical protein